MFFPSIWILKLSTNRFCILQPTFCYLEILNDFLGYVREQSKAVMYSRGWTSRIVWDGTLLFYKESTKLKTRSSSSALSLLSLMLWAVIRWSSVEEEMGVNKGMEEPSSRDGQSQGAILFVFCSYLILNNLILWLLGLFTSYTVLLLL